MAERPYTVLCCGMSIDGYLDSIGAQASIATIRHHLLHASPTSAPFCKR